MIIKVLKFEKRVDAHYCEVHGEGFMRKCFIDLLSSGDFPKDTQPGDLLGKTFSVEHTYPFITVASGIKEVV